MNEKDTGTHQEIDRRLEEASHLDEKYGYGHARQRYMLDQETASYAELEMLAETSRVERLEGLVSYLESVIITAESMVLDLVRLSNQLTGDTLQASIEEDIRRATERENNERRTRDD